MDVQSFYRKPNAIYNSKFILIHSWSTSQYFPLENGESWILFKQFTTTTIKDLHCWYPDNPFFMKSTSKKLKIIYEPSMGGRFQSGPHYVEKQAIYSPCSRPSQNYIQKIQLIHSNYMFLMNNI